MNTHLIQVELTPTQYANLTKDMISPRPSLTDYWKNIPTYLIARCPLCGSLYTGQLDTYSLQYWSRAEHGTCIYYEFAEASGCRHFVRAHKFINLNGVLPTELKHQKTFGSEVPYVQPFWLTSDQPAFAVIHAIPICRSDGQTFAPQYSLYMITYYAEDPEEMLQRRWQAANAWATLLPPEFFNDQEEVFDLRRWVERGKLRWLDPDLPALPLSTKSAEEFPYARIQGSVQQRVYTGQAWASQSLT